MSKELQALRKIHDNWNCMNPNSNGCDDNDFKLIENALKNYEEGLYHAKTYVEHTSKQALCDLLGLAIKNVHKSYWKLPEQLYEDVNKSLKALELIKENIGLKMSVDEDIGCLYVPITKCFQPLEQNIVIVGFVEGKDKIDLVKEVLS